MPEGEHFGFSQTSFGSPDFALSAEKHVCFRGRWIPSPVPQDLPESDVQAGGKRGHVQVGERAANQSLSTKMHFPPPPLCFFKVIPGTQHP